MSGANGNQRIGLTVREQRATSREPLEAAQSPVRSLYIHVPFCFHKCHYCDFYSFVDTQDRQAAFVDRLVEELRAFARYSGERSWLETVFVGGGTPSLLRVELWERLLGVMHDLFEFPEEGGRRQRGRQRGGEEAEKTEALTPALSQGEREQAFEFTVECNPETVTRELMDVLFAGGVNRVSVGAQSFHAAHLKTLERWHEPVNVNKALAIAAEAGIARRNLDLIFAIPGQTMDEWIADLDTALAMRVGGGEAAVDHVSCYALTYEANTAMTARLGRGEFARADEDLEADMYLAAVERLRAAGFDRYEVSNFAKRGSECRHNLAYWRQNEWHAAGPSGSAHVGGWRWRNVPRLTDWMEGVEASGGFSPVVDSEPPDARRALAERIMMGLRLREGVRGREVMERAEKIGAGERLMVAAKKARDRGVLVMDDERWRVSDQGFLFADGVAGELMASLGEHSA